MVVEDNPIYEDRYFLGEQIIYPNTSLTILAVNKDDQPKHF